LLSLNDHIIESPNLVNEWKFYKWQSALDPAIDESRIKKEYFVADINKTINSKFEQTTPLTVRNYFEGGNGGMILFGEKNFDVTNRNSPYTENAFIYNPPDIQSIYRAEVQQTHNLFNTTWNFWKWENGSTNRIREAQISQSSPSEWRAIYKGNLTSNSTDGISSNSQRKIVRTDNGKYHVVYESLGHVWYTHSLTNDYYGQWRQDKCLSIDVATVAKNPSIDYDGNIIKIVFEGYYPETAIIYLVTYAPDANGNYSQSGSDEQLLSYSPSYFGNAKPVITYNTYGDDGEVFVAYRRSSTGPIKQMTQWGKNGSWSSWSSETYIPNTNGDCVNPSVTGFSSSIYITYENFGTIYFLTAFREELLGNYSWNYIKNPINISAGSGFNLNRYPVISISKNPNPYLIISWQGIYDASATNPGAPKAGGSEPLIRKGAVVKVGWSTSWSGTTNNFGSNVEFTNNGSLDAAFGSVIAWSEVNGQYSKYTVRRRVGEYDPIITLSDNGIHTLISNGNNFGSMKAMVFNKTGNPPYLLNRCANDFTENWSGFGKITEAGVIDISYGRSGIIEKNGIEFVFNIGDVLLNGETIKFFERADTLAVTSIEELNLSVRTDTLYLNPQSELIFSDYYYVVNGNWADSLLSNDFNVNFKCELVKLSTGEAIGVFEEISYNKTNLDEYGHQGYLVDCSGIEAGDYYLRLTAAVNEEVGLSLSDIQMDNVVLNKSKLNVRNFKGESLPIDYSLEQNYPNPFNPTTTIRYQIPKDGMVTLKVYDILGAEVATLVNEEKVAGKYEVGFDASRLASGVYIYRLNVNDFVNVNKMVMLK
jgi:hypothetical protein